MKHIHAILAVAISTCGLSATADTKSEAYVAAKANTVLQVLNDDTLSEAERSEKFAQFMSEFADIKSIGRRVLGSASRAMTKTQLEAYQVAFHDYALAIYQQRLSEYRGAAIKVTGSRDLTDRNSHVRSIVQSQEGAQEAEVTWDVLESRDGSRYIVRDVALDIGGGNRYWLAIDQHENFQAFLRQNGNDPDKLIREIGIMTDRVNARTAAAR